MKIVSWNINGLRATLKNAGKDLKGVLDSLDADIICFQETKAQRDQLDSTTYLAEGYNGYFSFCQTKSGYSGVVTFCRNCATPLAAEEGVTGVLSSERSDAVKCYEKMDEFTSEELASLDAEGRAVLTEHLLQDSTGDNNKKKNLVIVNIYCPMVDKDNQERLEYKLKFYSALQTRCTALERNGKLLIVLGDFNCSREAIDSAYVREDPSLLLSRSPTREWMQQFAISDPTQLSPHTSPQLVDTFRYLHPTQEKAYTCWSTLIDARKTNYGTRIDYILASKELAWSVTKGEVWQHVMGSDHCPVFAEFSVSLVANSRRTFPSLCSHHFSTGKQKKLSQFLSSSQNSGTKVTQSTAAGRGGPQARGVSTKRSRSVDVGVPTAKMRKKASVDQNTSKQTLLSFTKPSQSATNDSSTPTLNIDKDSRSEEIPTEDAELTKLSQSTTGDLDGLSQESSSSQPGSSQSTKKSSKLNQKWTKVFSVGRPKPPLCKGHSEPCVLRTVKKQGPNTSRQFWVCARPGGSKGDPLARCDFFQWKK